MTPMRERVLVTGDAGFAGARLGDRPVQAGQDAWRNPNPGWWLE